MLYILSIDLELLSLLCIFLSPQLTIQRLYINEETTKEPYNLILF
jgi:hypothetical protein